jgi:Conserved hypothetical protein 698
VGAENMQALRPSVSAAAALAPRIALSAIVAAIGYVTAPYVARFVPIPNMVIALVVGIALNPLAARPAVQPGMQFCVKTLLRWAVALLGLRVGLGDIAALGAQTAILIVVAMAVTVVSGFAFRAMERAGPRIRGACGGRHCRMRCLCYTCDIDSCFGLQGQEGGSASAGGILRPR